MIPKAIQWLIKNYGNSCYRLQFLPVNFIKNRTLAIHDIDTSIRKTPTSITTESKVDLKDKFYNISINFCMKKKRFPRSNLSNSRQFPV